mgnify:CR=1 FL=1
MLKFNLQIMGEQRVTQAFSNRGFRGFCWSCLECHGITVKITGYTRSAFLHRRWPMREPSVYSVSKILLVAQNSGISHFFFRICDGDLWIFCRDSQRFLCDPKLFWTCRDRTIAPWVLYHDGFVLGLQTYAPTPSLQSSLNCFANPNWVWSNAKGYE